MSIAASIRCWSCGKRKCMQSAANSYRCVKALGCNTRLHSGNGLYDQVSIKLLMIDLLLNLHTINHTNGIQTGYNRRGYSCESSQSGCMLELFEALLCVTFKVPKPPPQLPKSGEAPADGVSAGCQHFKIGKALRDQTRLVARKAEQSTSGLTVTPI